MIENVIGLHALPLGVAVNFVVNGREVLVPIESEMGKPARMVPLGQVARISISQGPPVVRTENALLSVYVYVDIRGRDIGTTLEQLEPQDLIKYGLIPEFVGRMPVVAALEELDDVSKVFSNVDIDASALATAIQLTGNAGANTLTGGSGNDVLVGGEGFFLIVEELAFAALAHPHHRVEQALGRIQARTIRAAAQAGAQLRFLGLAGNYITSESALVALVSCEKGGRDGGNHGLWCCWTFPRVVMI